MTDRLVEKLSSIARALRAVLGAPNYEQYLAHVRGSHAGRTPMSREQFVAERMENRYSKPGSRCC